MELLTFFLLTFTSFFTLLNPLGVMPVFLTMTASLTEKERAKTAKRAVIASFITLLIFAFSGQFMFNFFGISVDSFRIAGGIIFFFMGQDMLQARLSKIKVDDSEIKEYISDISITPLAIPMISGPGSITNAIVLMQDAQGITFKAVLIAAIAVNLVIMYLMLWGGSKITKFIGETGQKLMTRIMGLIVMVIAVEFFFTGLKPILTGILKDALK
ncbi:MAG: MarC family protein [Ignavibacteriaceae bacterium]|nr:MarC family protein [Ignavibacteriaceae bacterium]